jgi:hypothetical protein
VYGPHVDVDVGDLQPRYREPDFFRPETLPDGPADGLGDGDETRSPWGSRSSQSSTSSLGTTSVSPKLKGVMFRKATQRPSRQTKRAGTSPSMMRVKTVAKRRPWLVLRYWC